MSCDIFKDKTPMPPPNWQYDTPVRVAQTSRDGDTKLPGEKKHYDLAMHHVERPRRGHDV